jgi:hypothetical protein
VIGRWYRVAMAAALMGACTAHEPVQTLAAYPGVAQLDDMRPLQPRLTGPSARPRPGGQYELPIDSAESDIGRIAQRLVDAMERLGWTLEGIDHSTGGPRFIQTLVWTSGERRASVTVGGPFGATQGSGRAARILVSLCPPARETWCAAPASGYG